jgi:hypothetical protein
MELEIGKRYWLDSAKDVSGVYTGVSGGGFYLVDANKHEEPSKPSYDTLYERNIKMLEALKIAQQYVNVFMIRGEEPLVGESLKDDSFKILEAIKSCE